VEGVGRFASPTKIALGEREYGWLRRWVSELQPDILLREGELKIGDVVLEVLETPGHSPGSICLYYPEKRALFSGDVIFQDGIGRTDLPGGDSRQLKESIKRLTCLDVEYLLPGHGEPVRGKVAVERNFRQVANYWFQFI